jgi:nucleotide-binding universal stress UspA family protein
VFQHIVCATDFSDTAESAWQVACDLAQVHRAELTLVHVFADLPPSPDVAVPSVLQVWEEQRQWVETELDRRVADAGARGLRARAVLKMGPAAHGLVEAVTELHSDLVVVGTHGRTGLERVLLGSVAEQVVRTAPCAVLTVKARASERARAAA